MPLNINITLVLERGSSRGPALPCPAVYLVIRKRPSYCDETNIDYGCIRTALFIYTTGRGTYTAANEATYSST